MKLKLYFKQSDYNETTYFLRLSEQLHVTVTKLMTSFPAYRGMGMPSAFDAAAVYAVLVFVLYRLVPYCSSLDKII